MKAFVKMTDVPPHQELGAVKYDKALLGGRLQEVRKTAGLKQGEWADQLGVAGSAVSHWESGRNFPPTDVLLQYWFRLGVNLHWLLTGQTFDKDPTVQAIVKVLAKPSR